jgi:hypothetical protein
MNEQFKKDIKACTTTRELFDTVNRHFDTDAKLGIATKIALQVNLQSLVNTLNLKPKK